MPRQKNAFKRHRSPNNLSSGPSRVLPLRADASGFARSTERSVDAATIFRCVRRFGPEIAKGSVKHRSCRRLMWHADETHVRVGGKWRFPWRAVDQHVRMVDLRLTARRDAKAACAFFRQACDNAQPYQPMTIVTDKARSCAKIIAEGNRWSFPGKEIRHVDRKWKDNRNESDHAALKKLTTPTRAFKPLSAAKDPLKRIKHIRSTKRGDVRGKSAGAAGEVRPNSSLFQNAA